MHGEIVRLIRDRGFGFIRTDAGQEIFFHASAVQGTPFDSLSEGQEVTFDIAKDPRGRGDRAENVTPVAS